MVDTYAIHSSGFRLVHALESRPGQAVKRPAAVASFRLATSEPLTVVRVPAAQNDLAAAAGPDLPHHLLGLLDDDSGHPKIGLLTQDRSCL
jgi:hypothetical protein